MAEKSNPRFVPPIEKSVLKRLYTTDNSMLDRVNALQKAKKMVAIDKDVLGRSPCFKGTRIPVHDIAAMIANGDEKSAIRKAYPRLTAEQIDLAVLYAEAYPRRGRPRRGRPRRKPLWRKGKPVSSSP